MKKFLVAVALLVASLTVADSADGFDPASDVFIGGRDTKRNPRNTSTGALTETARRAGRTRFQV